MKLWHDEYEEHKKDIENILSMCTRLWERISWFLSIDPTFYESNFLEGQKINWGNKPPHVTDMNDMTFLNAALNVLSCTPSNLMDNNKKFMTKTHIRILLL